jgi:hypothetical protein
MVRKEMVLGHIPIRGLLRTWVNSANGSAIIPRMIDSKLAGTGETSMVSNLVEAYSIWIGGRIG